MKTEKRKQRVRARIRRNSDRIRLSVFKSNRHIYAQIIDDKTSKTIVSASTMEKSIYKPKASLCNKAMAEHIGKLIGERASAVGITQVVFDRGPYKYHGVVKTLADAARVSLEF